MELASIVSALSLPCEIPGRAPSMRTPASDKLTSPHMRSLDLDFVISGISVSFRSKDELTLLIPLIFSHAVSCKTSAKEGLQGETYKSQSANVPLRSILVVVSLRSADRLRYFGGCSIISCVM